ncbi:hypothetical protein KAR48_15360 [bacterium]|nr:hypothetical protein [bacterium]
MIQYQIMLEGEDVFEFTVDTSADTSIEDTDTCYSEWLLLERFQCKHCTLSTNNRKTCPAALSIKPLLERFSHCMSYETVDAIVHKGDVEYRASVSSQHALRSLSGLVMALSACPVLKKLRPLARHHIPFIEQDHTVIRFTGHYFIGQYLRAQEGKSPDWELEGLLELLNQIHVVNVNIAKRLRLAAEKDSMVNGIVILDTSAQHAETDIRDQLMELKSLYHSYLDVS